MCGIVGIWDYKNKVSRYDLEKMRKKLAHRGPDDRGVFIDEEGRVGLAHQRLSIIDLSSLAHQPMVDENLVIVFNGEIYNFREIKKELEERGYRFKSNSDTEVILKSYREWGKKSVDKFRGMFSFAILDKRKEKLILCRDRAGVKPLYYYFNKDLFIFASELKAIISHPKVKKEINFNALALFLNRGHIPAPHSIFKNIYKLEAGHFLEINSKGEITKEEYWDIIDFYLMVDKTSKNEDEIEEELEKILIDSFKLRLVSDVPIGIFLSGGIDSTLLTALLANNTNYPLKTFTIGFYEEKYNEADYAAKIAKYFGTEHHEIFCTQKQALDIIPKLPEIYDEPLGDSSTIPTHLVSRFARNYLKVSLSADGGDELFCGYDYYPQVNALFKKINSIPSFILSLVERGIGLLTPELLAPLIKPIMRCPNIQNKIKKIEKVLNKGNNLKEFFEIIQSSWLEDEIINLLSINFSFPEISSINFEKIKDLDPITQMQIIDFKNFFSSAILTKLDRATMAVGLEGREPFLDQNIIEFAAKLPLGFKYKKKQSKYILRKILKKYLPKELFERPKNAFIPPIDIWFRDELKPLLREYLNPEKIEREKIFNKKIIEKELNDYFSGDLVTINRLWQILMFEMWREKYL